MSEVRDLLPKKIELIQVRGRIPREEYKECLAIMQKNEYSWGDALTIAVKLFNQEMKKLKAS